MAKCNRCQAETELYINELPICLRCDDDINDEKREQAPEPRPSPADGRDVAASRTPEESIPGAPRIWWRQARRGHS
jgi:hypothetical protein